MSVHRPALHRKCDSAPLPCSSGMWTPGFALALLPPQLVQMRKFWACLPVGDVWPKQPSPPDHPWRKMPRHAMTPHVSGDTVDAQVWRLHQPR